MPAADAQAVEPDAPGGGTCAKPATWKSRSGRSLAFAATLVMAAGIAAVFQFGAPARPQPARNLFDARAGFDAWVATLNLASLSTSVAIERLAALGFQCDTFQDGNVACFREARGSLCGERQFVDLLVPGEDGSPHRVATRFGRVCL
ncbi:MAG TPA: hypothetical protein VHB46_19125 [Burkholderiales bacterium]|nr:hypothetical protein [Burkholderiales bacterium]